MPRVAGHIPDGHFPDGHFPDGHFPELTLPRPDKYPATSPSFFPFIKVNYQNIVNLGERDQNSGAFLPPQERVYRDVNARIETLVPGYNNGNIIPFLRGISYNLSSQ